MHFYFPNSQSSKGHLPSNSGHEWVKLLFKVHNTDFENAYIKPQGGSKVELLNYMFCLGPLNKNIKNREAFEMYLRFLIAKVEQWVS